MKEREESMIKFSLDLFNRTEGDVVNGIQGTGRGALRRKLEVLLLSFSQ